MSSTSSRTITRPSRFELAISRKVWATAGVFTFSLLGVLSLAYEWSSWYSDGVPIYASRVGWGLLISSTGITVALLQLIFLAVWVGVNMGSHQRTVDPFFVVTPSASSSSSSASTTTTTAQAKASPAPTPVPRVACGFCPFVSKPTEYAPAIYQRRASLLNAMNWCDGIQLVALLLGFHTINIFRVVLLAFLVCFMAFSCVMTTQMRAAMDFWFSKSSENDVFVLRPLSLMPSYLTEGWRSTRAVFVWICVVYAVLFSCQYYYLYGHTQSLLESQRLLVAADEYRAAIGEFRTDVITAMTYGTNASASPHPQAPLTWVWIVDGLPCAFSDVTLPSTHALKTLDSQCLEVLSPDTADSTWYTTLTGTAPEFVGHRFFHSLDLKPETLYNTDDTEIYSTWNDLDIDFASSDNDLHDMERVIRESWWKLTGETFGDPDRLINATLDVTHARDMVIVRIQSGHWLETVRRFQFMFRKWADILQQYSAREWCVDEQGHSTNPLFDRPVTWIITSTHSSSREAGTFGGVIPSDDAIRRYVPWHVLALASGQSDDSGQSCQTHAKYGGGGGADTGPVKHNSVNSSYSAEPYHLPKDRFGDVITAGTIADVYPTLQMLRLQPLSVYSTGMPIHSTTARVWTARIGQDASQIFHAIYDTHLRRLRAILARHAQLSIGIQSAEELVRNERAYQNQGFGSEDDTLCYSTKDLLEHGLLHLNVTASGFVRPSREAEFDMLLSILQAQVDRQQHIRYMTPDAWDTWRASLEYQAFWLAVVRNVFLAIAVTFALFVWLRNAVYSRTLWTDTTFSFHPKLAQIIDANHNTEFVDLVTVTLFVAIGFLVISTVIVLGSLLLIYVLANALRLQDIDFQVFHLDTQFNGLATYFTVCVIGSALVNVLLHVREHYRMNDSELNPKIDASDSRRHGTHEEDVPLMPRPAVAKSSVWAVQRESVNVQHFYSLVAHMFVHVFVYGVLFCVQGSYMAPFPVAAPTWFASMTAMRETWKIQTVMLSMIPASCCVIARAFWYAPRMYVFEEKAKSKATAVGAVVAPLPSPSSSHDVSKPPALAATEVVPASEALTKPSPPPRRIIQHTLDEFADIPQLDSNAGAWTRLYAYKDAIVE